jgi:TonB family protein
MALRCFVFCPDEGTSDVIRQALTGLDVEGESCPEAATAGEKIAKESFQLVVIDWDLQPDATTLLTAARERKASERPLVLAIVSDDPSVPKALQAGANSILRRPLLMNQVKDTLTTARDLLRARLESATAAQAAAAAAAAASSGSASTASESAEPQSEHALRAGEFLNADAAEPGGQFETEAKPPSAQDMAVAEHVTPLRDLEPMASSMPEPPPPPEPPRSLEELLRSRGVGRHSGPPEPPADSAGGKPEMLGFNQTSSYSSNASGAAPARAREPKKEPELFSSITGESEEPKAASPSRFRLGKGMILVAAILAGCAVVLAPQAPWHTMVQGLWAHGQHSLHTWLNPQPVTTPVVPSAHEDFSRAGDEYKLPVAEAIPDATTDPSQIHVVPVVDPTAKKPSNGSAGQDQPAVIETPTASPADGSQPSATPTPDNQTQQPAPAATQPVAAPVPSVTTSPAPQVTVPSTITTAPATQSPNASVTYAPVSPAAEPPKRQPTSYVPPPAPKVPSSLQSQMATMVPDASGNKAPESAMQSIEPVAVSELTERALLTDQPPLDFPAAAGGQRGTVSLQVLIGRDGTIQDAKFLQGSLAFARAAIDGVKQWKFKPYMMNGRPVSVQTTLTLKFPPQ